MIRYSKLYLHNIYYILKHKIYVIYEKTCIKVFTFIVQKNGIGKK